jgi:uncharacterized protein
MKIHEFIIFISIVLLVYISSNLYIFIRGNQALNDIPWLRITYCVIYAFLFLSYIIGVILGRADPGQLSAFLKLVGGYWLGAMLYFFLLILLLDIFRVINHFLPFFPEIIKNNYENARLFTAGLFVLIVTVIVIVASYNAAHPITKIVNIEIDKKTNKFESLKVVMVSDIHIGEIIGRECMEKLVDSINKQEPDLVLIPGDILDESSAYIIKSNFAEPLKNIKSRLGVYACTGNHEYFGSIQDAIDYIGSLNIKLLQDTAVLIDSSYYLIGRDDRMKKSMSGIDRKSLSEIIAPLDKRLPLILMDHQPSNLEDAQNHEIDLQVSGHTHDAQLFPLNYIARSVYEIDWGYKRRGTTQYYVSCGYGTWGPPMRLGNKPEMVVFNIRFRETNQ